MLSIISQQWIEYVQDLFLVLIPTSVALITAWNATKTFRLRRDLETSERFLELLDDASGSGPVKPGTHIDLARQLATVHLLADFAKREKTLRNAAKSGLTEISGWDKSDSHIKMADAAKEGLERLSRKQYFWVR